MRKKNRNFHSSKAPKSLEFSSPSKSTPSLTQPNRIGINFYEENATTVGYLANVKSTTYTDQNNNEFAALLMFFIGEDGSWGKGYFPYQPYFCLLVEEECIRELIFILNKEYADFLDSIDVVDKEDLDLINHLSGKTQKYLKLKFRNVS